MSNSLLIDSNQFIVVRNSSVTLDLLSQSGKVLFFESLELADTESSRDYVIRRSFGGDAECVLWAGSEGALMLYVNKYSGKFEREVKGIAACILSGVPVGHSDNGHGGNKVPRVPVKPRAPSPIKLRAPSPIKQRVSLSS